VVLLSKTRAHGNVQGRKYVAGYPIALPENRNREGALDMKNIMLLGGVFLLTGCPGHGDRMVGRESTTTFIKDNQVCVMSPLEPQERITAIQINSDNSDSLYKIFDDKPVYVPKGECLPVFGFKFASGKRYNFAYDVQSDKSVSHLVVAEFSYPKE
jgi:hypothetical protein